MRKLQINTPRTLRLLVLVALIYLPAEAGAVSVVSSRAVLGGDDFLDWSTLGATGTVVVDNNAGGLFPSFNITSANGMVVNVQVSETIRRPDNPVAIDTLGSYASLTARDMFFNDGRPNASVIRIRFDFPQLVAGIGGDIFFDSNFTSSLAGVTLFDAAGFPISGGGQILANSGSTSTFTGFRGIVSDDRQPLFDQAEISFSTGLHSATHFDLEVALNRLDIVTGAAVVPTPSAAGIGLTAFTLLALRRGSARRRDTVQATG